MATLPGRPQTKVRMLAPKKSFGMFRTKNLLASQLVFYIKQSALKYREFEGRTG
jgi:hypothetical protein